VYLDLPFWHVFGLLWLISSLKNLMVPSFNATVKSSKE
jgi:hypothetical protein